MDPVERRSILTVNDNPNTGQDYIIDLKDKIHPLSLIIEDVVTIKLRYVPDKYVLVPSNYGQYLQGYENEKFSDIGIEEIAGMILEDLNNELLPSWIHLHISVERDLARHQVTMEDSQPEWSNNALLSRLKAL